MAEVERIDPISEGAFVTLNSESGQLVAFCYPFACDLDDHVGNRLHADFVVELRSPYFEDWSAAERELAARQRLDRTGTHSYSGCGQVIDPRNGLVQACGFVIDFGEVPSGAEFVEFEVTRFSL